MIAEHMPVQIRRCGTTVPVQRLVIGDLLYDPLCDNYIEIVDILSRDTQRLKHRLARIRSGQLGGDAPRQDVILSQHQAVACVGRSQPRGSHRLDFGAACDLGEEYRVETRLYALFAERPGCICVAGAVLQLADYPIANPHPVQFAQGGR